MHSLNTLTLPSSRYWCPCHFIEAVPVLHTLCLALLSVPCSGHTVPTSDKVTHKRHAVRDAQSVLAAGSALRSQDSRSVCASDPKGSVVAMPGAQHSVLHHPGLKLPHRPLLCQHATGAP